MPVNQATIKQQSVTTVNGKEYVRWNTVNNYLKSFGFLQEVAKEDYIPENMFYRLAMKASNETAQKFQATVAARLNRRRRVSSDARAGFASSNRQSSDAAD